MTNVFAFNRKLVLMFIMSATLLLAQAATLQHALDHDHHTYHESCEGFLAWDHNETNIDSLVTETDHFFQQPIVSFHQANFARRLIVGFSARAPPLNTHA